MFILATFWEIVIFLISSILTSYIYLTWNFDYWKKKGVNFLKPIPLFGNMLQVVTVKKSIGNLFEEIYVKYCDQDFIGLWVFTKPALLVLNIDMVRNVLVKDFKYFRDRPIHCDSEVDPLGSYNLFVIQNPYWKALRVKLTPYFTSSKIKSMFDLINKAGQDLDEYIGDKVKNKSDVFDLKELFEMFAIDSITTIAFGIEANCFKDSDSLFRKLGRKFSDFQWLRALEFSALFFAPDIAKIFKFKFFSSESSDVMRKVFWDVMKQREKNPIERNDLINILVQMQNDNIDEEGHLKLKGDILVAQAAIFFAGGFDTSSAIITHCIYELALNPKIQEKLYDDICTIVEKNNGDLNYDVIQQMKYLDMCIKEAMRKYPPLTFLDRLCKEKYTFPGTDVEIDKGVYVYIPVYAIHMDPDLYPNPTAFIPERFSPDNIANVKPFTFMPFGEGPRGCIGERLGYLQTKIGLYHVIKNYRVLKCPETIDKYVMDPQSVITRPLGGITLRMKPRN